MAALTFQRLRHFVSHSFSPQTKRGKVETEEKKKKKGKRKGGEKKKGKKKKKGGWGGC